MALPYDIPPAVAQPLSLHEAAFAICTVPVLFANSEVPTTDAPLDRSTHLQAKVSEGHHLVGAFCGLSEDDPNEPPSVHLFLLPMHHMAILRSRAAQGTIPGHHN